MTTPKPEYITDRSTGEVFELRDARLSPRQLWRMWEASLRQEFQRRKSGDLTLEVSVPVSCAGCTACCFFHRVLVYPANEAPEDLAHLELEEDEIGWKLKQREDGGCVHLGPEGCTVWEHRPSACRTFDCRVTAIAGAPLVVAAGHTAPLWSFDTTHVKDEAVVAVARKITELAMEASLTNDQPIDGTKLIGGIILGIGKGLTNALKQARQARKAGGRIALTAAEQVAQFRKGVTQGWFVGEDCDDQV
jgi:hypothetical protein